MCAFDRVWLDSNYLCFSLLVTHAGSFRECNVALCGLQLNDMWVVWRNEEGVNAFLCILCAGLDLVN